MSPDEAIDEHLESALERAEDDTARYHLRQALQLRVVEESRASRVDGSEQLERA